MCQPSNRGLTVVKDRSRNILQVLKYPNLKLDVNYFSFTAAFDNETLAFLFISLKSKYVDFTLKVDFKSLCHSESLAAMLQ